MIDLEDVASKIAFHLGDVLLGKLEAGWATCGVEHFPYLEFRVGTNPKGYTRIRILRNLGTNRFSVYFYGFPRVYLDSGICAEFNELSDEELNLKILEEFSLLEIVASERSD